ncbi:hypothetical protein B4U79_16572 [Dinothrombium tinctorium]|uniref:C2 domain-containing protein n=1 Tax=Dinothrombium tinctorium TaxID=1965070 RepID=A0A3S4QFP2_9ACAR|nr:hypothetical protein B4U79_16572 [Dinothrombium tinctorium]
MEAIKNIIRKTIELIRCYCPFVVNIHKKRETWLYLIQVIGVIGCIHLFRTMEEDIYGCLCFFAMIYIYYLVKRRFDYETVRKVVNELINQQDRKINSNWTLSKQEALHLLPAQELQRSIWLKNILQRIWPSFLADLIQAEINKVYSTAIDNNYVTKLMKVITFSCFMVNKDSPPSISDISIAEEALRVDEIVLFAYLKIYGNIKLTLKTLSTPLILRDVCFREESRIVLRPLQAYSPFVGGFAFWFCEKPVVDYDFPPEFKQLFKDDNDFNDFLEFLIKKVSHQFVTPNKIYIQFGDFASIEVSQKVKFPIPLAIAFLQVIEAENLLRVSHIFNPFCVLRIGSNFKQRFFSRSKHHSPLFDVSCWAIIHDFYEECEIEMFNSTLGENKFLGSVKFSIKDRAFSVHERSGTDINGMDIWLPLEKTTQGMIHFRFTVFILSSNEKAISQAFTQMKGFELDKYNFPIAVVSVFMKSFERTLRIERLKRSKDYSHHKMQVRYENPALQSLKKSPYLMGETTPVLGTNGVYTWEEGFHFFTDNPFEDRKDLVFTLFELTKEAESEKAFRPTASGKISFSTILDFCEKNRTPLVYTNFVHLTRGDGTEIGKLHAVIAVRIVKVDRSVLEKMCIAPEIRAIDVESKTITACERCADYVKNIAFEHGEDIDIVKQDVMEAGEYKESNACRVRLQFRLADRHIILIDVIRVINIPIFNYNEKPESQVVIELWRGNVKVTQKSTAFKPRNRDPVFGRRFKFLISDGNLQRHLIRVLIATRTGFFRKRIALVAETFCGFPRLEVDGGSVLEWFELSFIGIPID